VAGTLKNAPADGKLPVGSEIVTATAGSDTLTKPTPASFSEFVTSHAPNPVTIDYQLKGKSHSVVLTPANGLVAGNPSKYIVGTSLSLVDIQKESIPTAVIEGFKMTYHGTYSIAAGLLSLIKDSIVGKADFSGIAGPVGIVGMVGDAASYGLTPLLTFTAMISLNLAVINLLPFPALDGGRLVFVAIEAITKRRVPPNWTGWTNLIGFAILMILMAAVTINDLSRLF
jgi:regulator of sigma E protease